MIECGCCVELWDKESIKYSVDYNIPMCYSCAADHTCVKCGDVMSANNFWLELNICRYCLREIDKKLEKIVLKEEGFNDH